MNETVDQLLAETGALRRGHFLLSSGLHSDTYVQCARLLEWPDKAEAVGRALADLCRDLHPQVVVGPALGGVLVAHEVARALGVRGLFTERRGEQMELRRGFSLAAGERVLVVEDVVTTGRSTGEVLAVVGELGVEVVGIGAIVDRTADDSPFPMPFRALVRVEAATHEADGCPLCRDGSRAEKPGSRAGA